jgi:Spy/CpxP family protein refolding chaperone
MLTVALTAPAACLAQGEPAGAKQGDPLAMYRAAGIDHDQEQKLGALTKEFEQVMIPKTKSLLALVHEMRELSLQPDPDQDAVLAKQEEINKLNGELSLDRMRFALKMRNVLSPEQKEKFAEIVKQRTQTQAAGSKEDSQPGLATGKQ